MIQKRKQHMRTHVPSEKHNPLTDDIAHPDIKKNDMTESASNDLVLPSQVQIKQFLTYLVNEKTDELTKFLTENPTFLTITLTKNDIHEIERLQANKNWPARTIPKPCTPLIIACILGLKNVVKTLCEHNVNVDQVVGSNRNALMYAIVNASKTPENCPHRDIINILIDKTDLAYADKYGVDAVRCATRYNHPDIIRLLMSKQPDLDINHINKTPAVDQGYSSICQPPLLFEPFDDQFDAYNPDTVLCLLEYNADILVKNDECDIAFEQPWNARTEKAGQKATELTHIKNIFWTILDYKSYEETQTSGAANQDKKYTHQKETFLKKNFGYNSSYSQHKLGLLNAYRIAKLEYNKKSDAQSLAHLRTNLKYISKIIEYLSGKDKSEENRKSVLDKLCAQYLEEHNKTEEANKFIEKLKNEILLKTPELSPLQIAQEWISSIVSFFYEITMDLLSWIEKKIYFHSDVPRAPSEIPPSEIPTGLETQLHIQPESNQKITPPQNRAKKN